MSEREVTGETQAFLALRGIAREQIVDAIESGDFEEVDAQPYLEGDPGEGGFPATAETEEKLLGAHTSADTELNCDDQISLFLQIDTLEAFRRANLSRKQGRREMLAHLAFALAQENKYENLFQQRVVGTDKVVPG